MLGFKEYIQLLEVELSFFRDHPKLPELEGKLKGSTKLSSDEEKVLSQYNRKSAVLNLRLIKYHNNGITPPNNVPTEHGIYNLPAFDSATNKPFNRSFTMYSGIGFDPRTQMDKNNRILMPAYTSGSLDKRTSSMFMEYTDEHGFQHAFRLNIKHNDHGVSMSPIDTREHEIILPRNTILHIHRSEIDPEDPNVMVHHATIDHESDLDDFQKPIKLHLINDLMNKIQSKTHTNEDIDQASEQGYLTQDHLDELSKQLSHKIKQGTHTTDDIEQANKFGYMNSDIKNHLANNLIKKIKQGTHTINDLLDAIYNGYITDKGYHAINAIANNPELIDAHTRLANAHYDGRSIGQAAINAIANNPKSIQAQFTLAQAHFDGKDIGKTAIDAIANNPESTYAHKKLAEAHKAGKEIGQDAIDAIANNPESTDAHEWLTMAHHEVKEIGQAAINAIANHPKSIRAHEWLALAHKNKIHIGQRAIDAIANQPESTDAHAKLALAHKNKIHIGQGAIDAIVNNPDSRDAHKYLVMAHEEGKSIGDANYVKLLSYGS